MHKRLYTFHVCIDPITNNVSLFNYHSLKVTLINESTICKQLLVTDTTVCDTCPGNLEILALV